MATTQISAVRVSLKAIFTAAGHTVYAYPPGDTTGTLSYVYLGEISATQEYFDLSGNREEELTVNGTIRVHKAGASDAIAKTAEDAALAILDDLENSLSASPSISGAYFQAELSGPTSSEVLAGDGDRVCLLDFVVRVVTQI